jgi:hypothetical protein
MRVPAHDKMVGAYVSSNNRVIGSARDISGAIGKSVGTRHQSVVVVVVVVVACVGATAVGCLVCCLNLAVS